MKKIIYILLLFSQPMTGQNLVPNPGFEIITNCSLGGIANLPPWDSPTNGSPDPYNACETLSGISVPTNDAGYQYPHNGTGYVGASYRNINGYREYIQVELDTPLLAEQEYCASFYVSLADTFRFACNNFGMYFSNNHTFISGVAPLNFTPQINDTNIISDKVNWTLVYGHFTATGGEKYIIIGNFFSNALTDTIHLNNTPGPGDDAYYYIDDVNVHCCSCDSLDHTGINELSKSSDAFNLYPNPNNGLMILDYEINGKEAALFSILDITGRLVKQVTLNPENKIMTIDAAELNAGAYFYSIKVGTENGKTGKLIIVK